MRLLTMGLDARLYIVTHEPGIDAARVLDWAYDLASAFGAERFSIWRPGFSPWHLQGRHCLTIDESSGPDVTLIECHLSGRYYGVDYERGDLPVLLAVADWLRDTIPGAQVYYGNDADDVFYRKSECALVGVTLLDAAYRQELWAHFVAHGHKPYADYFGDALGDGVAPMCEMCQRPMTQYGFSGDGQRRSYRCSGCGYAIRTEDGGVTFASIPPEV